MKRYMNNIKNMRRPFRDEESQFLLWTGIKVVAVPFFVTFFMIFLLWVFTKFDLIFFESIGLKEVSFFGDNYYSRILDQTGKYFSYILISFIFLLFVGFYLGTVLLRPFQVISEHCQMLINGEDKSFNPELFSDFKILTRFSDYFFNITQSAKTNGEIKPVQIPLHFQGIHRPVFDKVFFFHFTLFVLIICISTSIFLTELTEVIHTEIVELALSSLKSPSSTVTFFLNSQRQILDAIIGVSVIFMGLFYLLLIIDLYRSVSGAAFGVFATMRSFLKGNYNARIHLVGYYYVRSYTRVINKYLDEINKNLAK